MKRTFSMAILASLLWSGCGKNEEVKPLSLAEAPKKLDEVMSKAAPDVREAAARISATLAKDSTSAYMDLKALLERTDLTPEQRATGGQCLEAANQKMLADAANGDVRAKQMIQLRKANR